jgi:hypothetical protein
MMKSGPNYRMSKAGKVDLARNWHRPNRAQRKRTIILGELYGAVIVKSRREKEG